jgi:hypothetical protein
MPVKERGLMIRKCRTILHRASTLTLLLSVSVSPCLCLSVSLSLSFSLSPFLYPPAPLSLPLFVPVETRELRF